MELAFKIGDRVYYNNQEGVVIKVGDCHSEYLNKDYKIVYVDFNKNGRISSFSLNTDFDIDINELGIIVEDLSYEPTGT